VHHALLDLTGFGELSFEAGYFGVHVGEDSSDGSLFVFGGGKNQEELF
jgi:hypothetical protein